uniref:Putative secreted protein n=1 Tax=Ixodes ricinus TaxID=34613 RepID=A0A6B0TUT6_IXORI
MILPFLLFVKAPYCVCFCFVFCMSACMRAPNYCFICWFVHHEWQYCYNRCQPHSGHPCDFSLCVYLNVTIQLK